MIEPNRQDCATSDREGSVHLAFCTVASLSALKRNAPSILPTVWRRVRDLQRHAHRSVCSTTLASEGASTEPQGFSTSRSRSAEIFRGGEHLQKNTSMAAQTNKTATYGDLWRHNRDPQTRVDGVGGVAVVADCRTPV